MSVPSTCQSLAEEDAASREPTSSKLPFTKWPQEAYYEAVVEVFNTFINEQDRSIVDAVRPPMKDHQSPKKKQRVNNEETATSSNSAARASNNIVSVAAVRSTIKCFDFSNHPTTKHNQVQTFD